MSEHTRNRVGEQIGNYRLTRLIGQGGFADVYLGEHIFLKTQAAIKLLRLHFANDRREGFLNEAQTIAKLKHPHIVHVFEGGVEDGMPFLVMDYVPNGSLRQRHPKGSRLLPEQIGLYVRQVASALYYAHQQKLIHRDVKPENMLVGQNGEVLLSDFGLVLEAHSSGSQTTKEMAGTIPYMAPEQLQGRPRIASDQYALGVVVYEWWCGERPFTGSFVEIAGQHIMAPPPSLCQRVPGLSAEIERVVFKALAKDPTQRFENVPAFADALTNAIQSFSTTFVWPLRGGQQANTPLPSVGESNVSTFLRSDPFGQGVQNVQSFSTSQQAAFSVSQPMSFSTQPQPTYLLTPPAEMLTPNPGSASFLPDSYPSQIPGKQNVPVSQKRRGRFWGVLGLLMVFLLIGSSLFFFFGHWRLPYPIGKATATTQRSQLIVQETASASVGTTSTVQATSTTQPTLTAQATSTVSTQLSPTVQPTTPVPVQTTPVGRPPNYTVVDHIAQAALPVGVRTTVSASCSSGEQMLSGGYYMSDRVNPAVDSYPSAADTWTVTAYSGFSNATLSAYVTCLQANFSANVQIFSFASSAGSPTTYTCPSGSALTGGGFRGYATRAEPNGNGWLGQSLSGSTNTNYVLCAIANLLQAASQTFSFSVPPRTSSVIETLSCPAGTQITGGGFTYDYAIADVYIDVPRGDAPTSGWSVGVYNNDSANTRNASAWAVCVQVPKSVS